MNEAVLLDEVLIALRRILRATELHSKRLNKTLGLTFPQLLLLKKLENRTQVTASKIASELSLSRATITSIVDRLEKRELVLRERSKEDRRVIYLSLTPQGEKMLETAPTPLQENFIYNLKNLEEWQQTMILSALQQVASMMDAEDIDASPMLEIGELTRPPTTLDKSAG